MDKVIQLKAEIFDIIAAQEQLKDQFGQLEQYKQQKLREVQAEQERHGREAAVDSGPVLPDE